MKKSTFIVTNAPTSIGIVLAFVLIGIMLFVAIKKCPIFAKNSTENFIQFRDPIYLSGRREDYYEEEATGKLGYSFWGGYPFFFHSPA